jgi:hypothetical protein
LGSETVHIISAKLTRRLRKFELLKQTEYLQSGWTQQIQSSIDSANSFIKQHWQELVDNTQADIDTTTVRNLQPDTDLDMNLSGLDAFLSQVASRQRDTTLSTFNPTSEYPMFQAAKLPNSPVGPEEYKHFRLAAFEKWVECHLADWIEHHLRAADTCGKLRTLLINYYGVASVAYDRAPVGTSVMYLTLAELWIACDKCACANYPMLVEYDPEIRLTEFQCLALPLKSHMKRLNEVERYVQSRQDKAIKVKASVYRQFGNPSSFAVKYFDQSEELQATLREIEVDAAAKQKQKREELKNLKHQYKQYMDHYNKANCEYHTVVVKRYHGYTEERHSKRCGRCASKNSADAMTIQIYEWPVSSIPSVAKATVFELVVPEAFSDWRDASAYFINTVLGCQEAQPQRPSCSYTLDNHHDLSHMLSCYYSERRIVPLSDIKPHTGTHRKRRKAIPHLNDDDVCLENALRYDYYDTSLGCFNRAMPSCTEKIPKTGMYQMPQRSKVLERFMYHPPSSPHGLPANEVIVSFNFPKTNTV